MAAELSRFMTTTKLTAGTDRRKFRNKNTQGAKEDGGGEKARRVRFSHSHSVIRSTCAIGIYLAVFTDLGYDGVGKEWAKLEIRGSQWNNNVCMRNCRSLVLSPVYLRYLKYFLKTARSKRLTVHLP